MNDNDIFIKSEEASSILGVHPNTLYLMLKRGEVKGTKVGPLWRFKKQHLLDILNNKESNDE